MPADQKSTEPVAPALEVKDVSKSFGGTHVLNSCSLRVKVGSITGLIGPNGAGKSTLFNILAGDIACDHGELFYFGRTIDHASAPELFERGILRTFQIPQEFSNLTVLENLMVVAKEQMGERLIMNWFRPLSIQSQEKGLRLKARKVLEQLKLDELRHHLASSLSGGQKKLLELGRTMMVEHPRILLLDEIAAGVNRSLLNVLIENITRLNRDLGVTIFVIEHDMALIERICQNVIVMAEGQVLDEGPFEKICQNPAVLNAYFGPNQDTKTPHT